MSVRVEQEPAYLLHARAQGETSMLLEVITAHHGRVPALAKGVRGGKGTRRALLQPGQPLLLSWTEASSWAHVRSIDAAGPPTALAGDALMSLWYAHELALQIVPRRVPDATLFADYMALLAMLGDQALEDALRRWEWRLLQLPHGHLDAANTAGRHWHYSAQFGLQAASAGAGAIDGESIQALRGAAPLSSEARQRLKPWLKAALAAHLTQPLKAPELLRSLRQIAG